MVQSHQDIETSHVLLQRILHSKKTDVTLTQDGTNIVFASERANPQATSDTVRLEQREALSDYVSQFDVRNAHVGVTISENYSPTRPVNEYSIMMPREEVSKLSILMSEDMQNKINAVEEIALAQDAARAEQNAAKLAREALAEEARESAKKDGEEIIDLAPANSSVSPSDASTVGGIPVKVEQGKS